MGLLAIPFSLGFSNKKIFCLYVAPSSSSACSSYKRDYIMFINIDVCLSLTFYSLSKHLFLVYHPYWLISVDDHHVCVKSRLLAFLPNKKSLFECKCNVMWWMNEWIWLDKNYFSMKMETLQQKFQRII